MTNQELAESYRSRVDNFNEDVPLDYYDRSVDLALYFNETIPDDESGKAELLQMLEDVMVSAYVARDHIFEVKNQTEDSGNEGLTKEEVNDPNGSPA